MRQVEAHIILNILIFNMTAILPHTWQVILKCLLSLLPPASRLTCKRPDSVPLPDSFLCQRLLCPPCHTWGINQLYSLEVHLRQKWRAGGIIISASSLFQGTESEACLSQTEYMNTCPIHIVSPQLIHFNSANTYYTPVTSRPSPRC